MNRPHVAIVGMPGSGKTTVGSIVAERAGLPLLDGDVALIECTGRTARKIAEADGVDALHATERTVTATLLDEPEPAVIAPPASALDDPSTVVAIRDRSWLVVLLDLDPSVATDRAAASGDRRPMDLAEMAARWEARRPAAMSIADVVLDATRPPTELAEHIAAIRAC